MRQARALPLPNEALHIEEIKFWLKVMQEHTEFIRAGLPLDANDYFDAAREFHKAFTSLLQKAERIKSIKQSGDFISEVSSAMEEFQRYQRSLLAERLCCQLNGNLFPFFLDHIIREAKCFLDLLLRMQEGEAALKSGSHTREIVVWLRCMADHTRLIYHFVDPSERRIEKMAMEFAELFDHLVLEGRDLASLLYCHRGEVRAFHRFLLDVRLDVQRLRDFNKMAEDLIGGCRLLGIMNTMLASHMRKEAEHCLLSIALLEKEIIKHCPDDFQDDLEPGFYAEYERQEDEAPLADDEDCRDEQEEETEESGEYGFSSGAERRDTPAEAPAFLEEFVQEEEPVIAILPVRQAKTDLDMGADPVMFPALEQSEAVGKTERLQTDKEPVYTKTADSQCMPRKFSGRTPGERCSKGHNREKLPRALGKAKKG